VSGEGNAVTVPPVPRTGTRVFAILGNPVAHSLSPAIQNAALRAAGLDGRYVAIACQPEDVAPVMRTLARAGGGGNVTVPHKGRAAVTLDAAAAAVARTGACNTFWGEGARIRGDNTDVEGARRAVRALLAGPARGARVLLAGAGGGARAAVAALIDEDAGEVRVVNRTRARALTMAGEVGDARVGVAADARALEGQAFDLVLNATSLGLGRHDPLAVDLDRLGPVGAVMDMVYSPRETRLTAAARERGIPAMDGGEMLLRQGAAAFELWWGREAPLAAMREALERARRTGRGSGRRSS